MKSVFRYAAALSAFALFACATPRMGESGGAASSSSFNARMGESIKAGGAVVTPLAIIEDSRCPLGVQCIQAGTVRLNARVKRKGQESDVVVGLKKPADIGGVWLHLVEVFPYPRQPGAIAPADYSFIFSVTAAEGRE